MSFWAAGFWKVGFWKAGFWSGESDNEVEVAVGVQNAYFYLRNGGSLRDFKEGSAIPLRVRLMDELNEPTTPTTFRYRLDCRTTGREVVGWTSLTPDDDVLITITATQAELVSRGNLVERKVLTIHCDAGLATSFTDELQFDIKRTLGF